jgi:CheY-like chemotaxis protein
LIGTGWTHLKLNHYMEQRKTLAKAGFFLISYTISVMSVQGDAFCSGIVSAGMGIEGKRVTNQKKTILVIEDDLDVLSMMVRHLVHLGFNVITATDGMEGLKKLDSEEYDLVITDIVMPYVSGVGVVSAMKSKKPHIPVIAITGYGKEPEAAAMEKNADMVLAKPVKMSVLRNYMSDLLSLSEGKDEP